MLVQREPTKGLRGRLKRRRPSEPDPGNAGAGRLERLGRTTAVTEETNSGFDAIFVGGGVIGLASAWRASQRGARVSVLEAERPAAGATGVAAGMLAPAGEASWGEESLLSLNLESLRRWPGFAEELERAAGIEIGFARRGALHVALDRDEAESLRRRYELHRQLGLDSGWLAGGACRKLEPGFATGVRGGAHVPGEASVDPRRVVAALLGALDRGGVPVHAGARVASAERSDGVWRLRAADGRTFGAAAVVLAAGCWSGQLDWIPQDARPPVRPVKGEILTLRGAADQPICERIVAGDRVYMVPRADGRLIVGATVEERGFDVTVTAGGVLELLREAYRLIPEIAELELAEMTAGLRPGSPDNAPLIGSSATEGLLIATGHFRNGMLQAPLTADCIADLLAGAKPPVDLEPFSPGRFAGSPAESAVEVA
jgi:glycine oxidase